MNAVTTTWRQLVRRRLWPVALLLLAALVAVPAVLARDAEVPAPLDPLSVTTEADDTIAEPVVAKVTAEDRDRRRRVLGVRKDPFRPAPVKKPKAAETAAKAGVDTAPEPKPGPTGPVGGSDGGGGAAPVPVTGGAPAPKKKYYSPGTIIVRFAEASSEESARFAVKKLEPLPDDEFPLLVYMGLTKNGKKARFLVDAALEVEGDGTCKPHPSNCEVIELAVGETEFLDVINPEPAEGAEGETEETEDAPEVVAQFQLDLVDIKRAGDDDVR